MINTTVLHITNIIVFLLNIYLYSLTKETCWLILMALPIISSFALAGKDK